MGMDLEPIAPDKEYPPADEYGSVWGRYNWAGWEHLLTQLKAWNVDAPSLVGYNDGVEIPDEECKRIGQAILAHLEEFDAGRSREINHKKALMWLHCGGYRQW